MALGNSIRKIGVTGGTGFIGQYLLRHCADRFECAVVTSGSGGRKRFDHPNIRYIVSDYSEESLHEAFAGCDAIVHLGAKRSDADSEKAFSNYQGNLLFSESVFRTARDLGITNVVNISSTAVYGYDMKPPFSEDAAVSPLSFYGACKRSIELIAALYNKKFGMRIKSLRLAQVIGEGERGGYMLTIFKDRCREGLPLNVYGHGRAGREYVYVRDVVRAIETAMDHPDSMGAFNIGMGVFTSNLELAETYCDVFENKAGCVLLTDKPETVFDYRMDVDKARRELGFACEYDLRSAIADVRRTLEEVGV